MHLAFPEQIMFTTQMEMLYNHPRAKLLKTLINIAFSILIRYIQFCYPVLMQPLMGFSPSAAASLLPTPYSLLPTPYSLFPLL
ncbi:MAG: hypothetical protein F6K55_29615 [Moorea sp. SIO4A3]|nr:hypothetical protein [Moorena sp. SIO4A3]